MAWPLPYDSEADGRVWGVLQANLPAVDLDGRAVALSMGKSHGCVILVSAISVLESWLWDGEDWCCGGAVLVRAERRVEGCGVCDGRGVSSSS